MLDKTRHGKTISVQNLFIEVNFNQLLSVYFRGLLMTETEPKWTWVPNERLGDLYFEQAYADFDAFIEDKWQWEHEDYHDDDEVIYQQIEGGDFFTFCGKAHVFDGAEINSALYYRGQNLIGLTLAAFKSCFTAADDWKLVGWNECYTSELLGVFVHLRDDKVESLYYYNDCFPDEQAQNAMINTAEPPWTWWPNLRVGDLYFEQGYANFNAFIADKELDPDHGFPDDDISAYRQTATGNYFVFQGKEHLFVNAIIYSETHYQGQNLIGLTLSAFKSCFAEINDWKVTEQNEFHTSEALNATMWLEDGKVASVSLSGDCADD